MRFINTVMLTVLMVFLGTQYSLSQIIAPTGTSTRASSQLIFYYDQTERDNMIQVTNSNDSSGVWIHVQIFRSFNIDDDPLVNVICDERNFVDFLTPNDTHVYSLSEDLFPKNVGETEGDPGESTTLDIRDTKGFVVITPVVSQSDLSAISFQHLFGDSNRAWPGSANIRGFTLNAMGRDAVNFTTGEIVPDGTPLDGVTNGYVLLQPEELLFDFAAFDGSVADIVGIAFADNYGPPGLLGYQVTPASATWTTFIFDFKESPTSCGNRQIQCFSTLGLNDTIWQSNRELSQRTDEVGDVLCAGAVTPEYPWDEFNNFDPDFANFGWTRIFVSGIGNMVNHIGFIAFEQPDGAEHMYVQGERTDPTPPPTCQFINGSPNCDDPLCAQEEVAEGLTCEEFNEDPAGFCGVDVPCEDPNCVGVEPNCPLPPTPTPTPAPGGGGGCSVAAGATAATAAANFLLPLLPLAGAFALRRMRRRNK